jgi:hypothetical protein
MMASNTEITKEWLENVLKVPVLQVLAHENPAFNSLVTHLDVTDAGNGDLPRNMLVKLNREHDGQNEIQFSRLVEGMDLPMIPRRLGLHYNPQSGLSYWILEDTSETHTAPVNRERLKGLNGVPNLESDKPSSTVLHSSITVFP